MTHVLFFKFTGGKIKMECNVFLLSMIIFIIINFNLTSLKELAIFL